MPNSDKGLLYAFVILLYQKALCISRRHPSGFDSSRINSPDDAIESFRCFGGFAFAGAIRQIRPTVDRLNQFAFQSLLPQIGRYILAC